MHTILDEVPLQKAGRLGYNAIHRLYAQAVDDGSLALDQLDETTVDDKLQVLIDAEIVER